MLIQFQFYRKPPPNPKGPAKFDRAVVLVRDPFEALLAEFNRKQSHNKTGYAADEKFDTEWQPYLSKSMDCWKDFYLYFKTQYKPHEVMFTTYEALQKDTVSELRHVLHFLGYDFPQDVAKCVVQQKEGLFHREKPVVDQFKYYNAKQKVVLKAMRHEVYKKLGIKILKPYIYDLIIKYLFACLFVSMIQEESNDNYRKSIK